MDAAELLLEHLQADQAIQQEISKRLGALGELCGRIEERVVSFDRALGEHKADDEKMALQIADMDRQMRWVKGWAAGAAAVVAATGAALLWLVDKLG